MGYGGTILIPRSPHGVGFCEQGNETTSPTKGEVFVEQLSYFQLLKKGSVPWSVIRYHNMGKQIRDEE
jgi:hypothetical protein